MVKSTLLYIIFFQRGAIIPIKKYLLKNINLQQVFLYFSSGYWNFIIFLSYTAIQFTGTMFFIMSPKKLSLTQKQLYASMSFLRQIKDSGSGP